MCTGGRAGGRAGVRYVITKFSQMDSLPNFLTHGAPLCARFAREELRYNMVAKYILLVFKVLIYKQTLNIYFGKQTVKLKKDYTEVSRVGLLFNFYLHYRSIYATFKLLAQFSFCSALKME